MLKAIRMKYISGAGKIRRFLLSRHYIEQQEKRRRGKCKRCGACCQLLFRCPFLQTQSDGSATCRIHCDKPRNCRIFPINEHDLHERNLHEKKISCGFYFEK